jgi:hypothetical protein
MLESARSMDAVTQQYARVGVKDRHGYNRSSRIKGRSIGA